MTAATSRITGRLIELGVTLPTPMAPRYAYDAVVVHGGIAYVSGQLPWRGTELAATGLVGGEAAAEDAAAAARVCVLNGLSVLQQALGSLDRVERFLKVTGFVASVPTFRDQPSVVDAASQLLIEIFGDAGRHARSAVGVAALPRGAAVEIEFICAVRQ